MTVRGVSAGIRDCRAGSAPRVATLRGGRLEVSFEWRGGFTNGEVNTLHAEAFETRLYSDDEWNWVDLTARHSLGWVTARAERELVGFVNVIWDGLTHVWVQDLMVAGSARGQGIGVELVHRVRSAAAAAGCEWLHVDFEADLAPFYLEACGFEPAQAGLMAL